MPKKALEAMTESMFYILLALLWGCSWAPAPCILFSPVSWNTVISGR